jgi:hypothetical protein
MNSTTPAACGKVQTELLANNEFKSLLRRAAAVRGRNRLRQYEQLKRQMDRICGWSSRNPAYGPEHWEAAIRMLSKVLGV